MNETETIIMELIKENVPELKNKVGLQVEKAHRISLKFNEKKATPRYILMSLLNSMIKKFFCKYPDRQSRLSIKAQKSD